ncbi:alpha-amylase family glycosyl hydrolase [Ligilactobacillus salivarius]
MNNIGTHDTQRIKTVLHNDDDKVIQSFRILFNLPGVPCIYYGDEVGVEGDADPDNRRFFPWGQEKSSRIIQEVKNLLIEERKIFYYKKVVWDLLLQEDHIVQLWQ